MVEGAFAALAAEHAVPIPEPGEFRALRRKGYDQLPERPVVDLSAAMGAELGDDAARPLLPPVDQLSRAWIQEDEAQEVALARPVEPAGEKPLRRLVPGAGVEMAVEHIGRSGDRGDAIGQGRRKCVVRLGALLG